MRLLQARWNCRPGIGLSHRAQRPAMTQATAAPPTAGSACRNRSTPSTDGIDRPKRAGATGRRPVRHTSARRAARGISRAWTTGITGPGRYNPGYGPLERRPHRGHARRPALTGGGTRRQPDFSYIWSPDIASIGYFKLQRGAGHKTRQLHCRRWCINSRPNHDCSPDEVPCDRGARRYLRGVPAGRTADGFMQVVPEGLYARSFAGGMSPSCSAAPEQAATSDASGDLLLRQSYSST